MATYQCWLCSPEGVRLYNLGCVVELSASKVAHKPGAVNLLVPTDFPTSYLNRDNLIQVWRSPAPSLTSKLFNTYFLRKWRRETKSGKRSIRLYGPDMLDLLRRRIVANYADSSYSAIENVAADYALQTLVTNAMLNSNPITQYGSRSWDNLTVRSSGDIGPEIDWAPVWDPLLTHSGGGILTDIVAAVLEQHDVYVFFDVRAKEATNLTATFEFVTWIGYPGVDLTSDFELTESTATLQGPYIEYDAYNEVTFAYGGGPGEGAGRYTTQKWDATRHDHSIWARQETFVDSSSDVLADVEEQTWLAVEQGQPVQRFGGVPLDTKAWKFGRDWNWGDKVRVSYDGEVHHGIITSIVLTVKQGREQIQARVELVT